MTADSTNKKSGKLRRIWRLTWRGVLCLVAIFAILLTISSIYQAIASSNEVTKSVPPGQLVDVGGYKLHLNCTGQGSPTIVLDAGLGESSLSWSKVQPEAAKFTRVCSYDRAGYAWSEISPSPRTSEQIVNELHTLLKNADVKPPYVLAGHSFGGFNVRLFAARYPDETAGLVLVDSSHEDQFERLPPSFRASGAINFLMKSVPWLTRLGILRILDQPAGNVKNYAPEVQPLARSIGFKSKAHDAAAAEFQSLLESAAQVKAIKMPNGSLLLGDKPLTVLMQGQQKQVPPQATADEIEEFKKLWRVLQEDLATRSSRGDLIVAEKSGHYILLEEPNLVIDALRRACEFTNK